MHNHTCNTMHWCSCAVIPQDIRARVEEEATDELGLTILTYIGAGLSILGLLLTIVTLLGSEYVDMLVS